MSVMATTTRPLQVWIGCANEFADRLVGAWYDADEAGEVTVEQLHRDAQAPLQPGCCELWCYDLSGFPRGTGEMSPATAQEWGDAYSEVEPHLWPALSAWVATGSYIAAGNGDVPVVSDFVDAHQGEWESFRAFAENLAEDTGMMVDWPEEAQRYFDWQSWVNDLRFDYTVADAPDGGVYVFLNP